MLKNCHFNSIYKFFSNRFIFLNEAPTPEPKQAEAPDKKTNTGIDPNAARREKLQSIRQREVDDKALDEARTSLEAHLAKEKWEAGASVHQDSLKSWRTMKPGEIPSDFAIQDGAKCTVGTIGITLNNGKAVFTVEMVDYKSYSAHLPTGDGRKEVKFSSSKDAIAYIHDVLRAKEVDSRTVTNSPKDKEKKAFVKNLDGLANSLISDGYAINKNEGSFTISKGGKKVGYIEVSATFNSDEQVSCAFRSSEVSYKTTLLLLKPDQSGFDDDSMSRLKRDLETKT